jgi:predicted RecB family nuclease
MEGRYTVDLGTATGPEQSAPGVKRVRTMYRRAVEAGDDATAKVIAAVANALMPSIKLTEGPVADASEAVDLSQQDAAAWDYALGMMWGSGAQASARARSLAELEEYDRLVGVEDGR